MHFDKGETMEEFAARIGAELRRKEQLEVEVATLRSVVEGFQKGCSRFTKKPLRWKTGAVPFCSTYFTINEIGQVGLHMSNKGENVGLKWVPSREILDLIEDE